MWSNKIEELDGDAVSNRGVLDPEEAIELYTESLRHDSSNALLYELRAKKYLIRGSNAEAMADFKKASELRSPSLINRSIASSPREVNEQMEDDSGEEDLEEESESAEDDSHGDTFFDEDASSLSELESNSEVPLTDEDVQCLINELLEAESKAAEAQENLEEESLAIVRDSVIAELSDTLFGPELDGAVKKEMETYIELWEDALDGFEDQSSLLQERLDDAGIDLPCLFKVIEKEAHETCTTEAWKKRTHWAGFKASQEAVDVVSKAEHDLDVQRPAKRHRGKLVEEGASGFISKRLTTLSTDDKEIGIQQIEGWESLDFLLKNEESVRKDRMYGGRAWAFVYLASTPEQAASLGLPGADQVEEIEDLEDCEKNPFLAAAVASEKESGLTEQQKISLRKVREEDDIRKARLMRRMTFKSKRASYKYKKNCTSDSCGPDKEDREIEGDTSIFSWNKDSTHPEFQDLGGHGAYTTDQGRNHRGKNSDDFPPQSVLGGNLLEFADKDMLELKQYKELCSISNSNQMVHDESTASKFFLETGVKYEEKSVKKETASNFKRSFVRDCNENSSKGRLLIDSNDLCDPAIVDEVIECSRPTGSKLLLDMSGRCYRSGDYELHNKMVLGSIINIESDEEQEAEECRRIRNNKAEGDLCMSAGFDGWKTKSNGKVVSGDVLGTDGRGTSVTSSDVPEGCTEDLAFQGKMISKSVFAPHSSDKMQPQSQQDDRDLKCTCCGQRLKVHEVLKHPLFDVAICKVCKKFYQSGPFTKDVDGIERECRWCGNGGAVILCETCNKVFCRECIRHNFGEEELQRILQTDWICFCCNSEPLKPLIEHFKAVFAGKFLSSDEDEQLFDEDISYSDEDDSVYTDTNQEVRNLKRNISYRKAQEIVDNVELDQDVEFLGMWQGGNIGGDMLSTSGIVPKVDNISAGTEGGKGFVINLNKDIDEEEVLIPWGISKILKPHQVEGVHFLWENCIESVLKVKSGGRGNGCILAHSMGLGKTLQVIAFLYTVLKKEDMGLRTALIVAPVNVLHNWLEEFGKWSLRNMDPITVFILDDMIRDNVKRAGLLKDWQRRGGVMIIGYTAFRNLSMGRHIKERSACERIWNALKNPGPDILVCDEAHMIKNREADITQSLKQVKTLRRIALTGSPLQNNLMEYYCMVDFVREGFLGTPREFKYRFQNPIENGQHADSTEADVKKMKRRTHVLHKQLTGFVQRMGPNVVERDLPPKYVFVISVRLSQLQRALYNKFIQLFWLQSSSVARSQKCLFTIYHTLAKIWNHPNLLLLSKEEKDISSEDSMDDFIVDDDEDTGSDDADDDQPKREGVKIKSGVIRRRDAEVMNAMNNLEWCSDLISEDQHGILEISGKMVLLMDILLMSSARGDKSLVFSQSLSTLNCIEMFLQKLPLPHTEGGHWRKDEEWYRLDGKTKAKARQKLVHQFNNPHNNKVKCVLISTRAGSLGINLQAANRVIIVDGSWNPTHDIQALFRAWRYGQTKPVFAYRLLAYGTAEEKIYKRQVAKESLAARVLDEQEVGRHSKMDELKVLFKLDDSAYNHDTLENFELGHSSSVIKNEVQMGISAVHASTNSVGKMPLGSSPSSYAVGSSVPEDDVMKSLLVDHQPRWIVKVHQHETLLEEIEDEKLTLEEQQRAWEDFNNREIEWVEEYSSGCIASQVENSWAVSVPLSLCPGKAHAELLSRRTIQMGDQTRCNVCNQNIGWEDVKHVKKAKVQTRC